MNFLILLLAVSLCSAFSGSAEEPSPSPAPVNPQQEITDQKAIWMENAAEARSLAKKDGKVLLLDFTGSDWCIWCKRLDAEVFSQPEFALYAARNLVLLKVDFPRDDSKQTQELREQNGKLAAAYRIEGYPTIILVSPEGKLIARMGYERGGAANYVKLLDRKVAAWRKTQTEKP